MGGMCALPVDEWRSPAGFADKVLKEWILEVSLCCSRHFAHHTAVIGSLDLKQTQYYNNTKVIQVRWGLFENADSKSLFWDADSFCCLHLKIKRGIHTRSLPDTSYTL